jgi:hypothetical protein
MVSLVVETTAGLDTPAGPTTGAVTAIASTHEKTIGTTVGDAL